MKKLDTRVFNNYLMPTIKKCEQEEEDENYVLLKGRNVRRQGNHIYFYDAIDDETQLWLQQSMNAAYEETVINSAREMTKNGTISDNIYLHINSPGGSVVSSLALYDFIKTFPTVVVGIVEGCACSGASILLCGCQLREMTASSSVLVHELRTWDPSIKKWSEVKDDYQNDQYLMDKLKKIYLKETTIPAQVIDDVLSHDVYWDTDKCIEYELCDVVYGHKLTDEIADSINKKVEKRLNQEAADYKEEVNEEKKAAPKKTRKSIVSKLKKDSND